MPHAFLVKMRLPCFSKQKGSSCGKSQDADSYDDAEDAKASIRVVERVNIVP